MQPILFIKMALNELYYNLSVFVTLWLNYYGESNFVQDVLFESEESFTLKYKLKRRGFNFEKVVDRVSLLFQLEKDYITGRGRQKNRVQARDLVCYWSAIELGISMKDLAKRLEITLAAVSYAVKRGEEATKEGDYLLKG